MLLVELEDAEATTVLDELVVEPLVRVLLDALLVELEDQLASTVEELDALDEVAEVADDVLSLDWLAGLSVLLEVALGVDQDELLVEAVELLDAETVMVDSEVVDEPLSLLVEPLDFVELETLLSDAVDLDELEVEELEDRDAAAVELLDVLPDDSLCGSTSVTTRECGMTMPYTSGSAGTPHRKAISETLPVGVETS